MRRTERGRLAAALVLALALAFGLWLMLLYDRAGMAAAFHANQAAATNCTTMVSADVTVPTTWTLAASPYCVQPGVDVNSGVTLTVEPGVTIYMITTTSGLTIAGNLIAVGTPTRPITITSFQTPPQPGDWARLYVLAGGYLRLEYADVSYGGHGRFIPEWQRGCTNPSYLPLADDGSAAVWVEDYVPVPEYPKIEIRRSRLHHNRGSGLYFYGTSCEGCGSAGGYVATVEDTQIDHNTGAAICEYNSLSEQHSAPTYRNLILSDNGADALVFPAGFSLYTDRTLDGPGSFNGRPILFLNGAGVRTAHHTNHVLTITAGTTLLFTPYEPDSGRWGHVGGHLIAEGTPTQPITFTSGAAAPRVGDWRGLDVDRGRLAYCDISYADKAVLIINSYDIIIRRCNIHHNDTGIDSFYALHPFPRITENSIHHNRIGVSQSGGLSPLHGNNIYANSEYGLKVFSQYWEPDARYVWWGHPTGPYHPVSNPSGLGDRVEDYWWQGYPVLPAKFIPWRTSPAEGSPPTIQPLLPVSGTTWTQIPLRFQVRVQDLNENEPLYFRVEIYAGYAPFRTYDQRDDPTGWDRASYAPGDGGWVTATLTLSEVLPNGDYTWQASVSDGWHSVTTPRQPFRVSLSGWGVSGVTPIEPVALPNVTQTLSLHGMGLTSGAQVWLEQARYDGQVTRLNPASLEFVSSQRINIRVNLIGRSGPWDVVVSQGGQKRRTPLYVLPYMALVAFDYMNEPELVMNHITPHDLHLSNHGTAAGVAIVGVIVPTGTQVLQPGRPDPQMEYLGRIGERTHLYAVHLAAQQDHRARLYFQLPQSEVNLPGQPHDPAKWNWGDPLRFRFWLLAQPTEEGWQVLRQETASLEELVNGAIWGSALIEGWALDQYAELADEAAAAEYIERLGVRYPFIADALVMRQLQEFQLLADLLLGVPEEPAGSVGQSALAVDADGRLDSQNSGFRQWVERQIGDPWSFAKGFLTQADENGIPWSSGSMEYERATFLVAEAEGLLNGLLFGLYKPKFGYWHYHHINGKEQGLIAIGHALGNFLSIPAGAKAPGELSRGAVNLVRKAADGLRPGGDRYWRSFKLTVQGNTQEPARLGLSVLWKGGDYNLIHWGYSPYYGGSHWAIGWTSQPVVIKGVVQTGARGEILFNSGTHIYAHHAYIPYRWRGAPFGQLDDIDLLRGEITLMHQVPAAAWRAGQVEESLKYPGSYIDETACGDGSQTLEASWDPNDITGWPQRTHIRPPQELEFLIRFENVATATLPANTVTVTLPLHPNLDWDSMQLVGSSHPQTVTVKANSDDRTLVWAFTGIRLPPNRNPPEGEGWVRLRVAPSATLTTGQQITAQAMIVFDQNDPIWTNVVTYTIDLHPPDPGLALAGFSGPWPLVRLTAADNPGGSGVGHLGLFYSPDNVHWFAGPKLMNITASEVFSGEVQLVAPSQHYWLRVAAADRVGNVSRLSEAMIEVDIILPYRAYLPVIMRRR